MKWLLTPRTCEIFEVIEKSGYCVLSSRDFPDVPTDLELAQIEGCVVSEDLSVLIRIKLNRQLNR